MRYGATGGAFAGGVLVFAVVVNIVGFPEAEIAEGMVGTAALFEVASAEPFVSAGTLALSGAAAGGTVGAMTAYGFTSPIPCK